MWKNKYKYERPDHYTPEGSEIHINYGWTYEDGELVFVEKDKVPLYAQIQAERDMCELSSILARYENGDDTALNKVNGMYLDIVDMPTNYAELYTAVSKANDIFYNMPTEIKEKYDNNAAMFWKNYGSDAFDDVVNAYRSEQLGKYGLVDEEPVNTVADMQKDMSKAIDDMSKKIKPDEKGGDVVE